MDNIAFDFYTVNDKNFEGEKFHSWLGSSGMCGKVLQFFPPPPSHIHGFPTLQDSYEQFNRSFTFFTWILLKTVISILGNGREYITDTCVCADFMLSRMTMQSLEKSYSWSESEMKQIANRFLVSFFCKLLPNLLADSLPLLWNISSNISNDLKQNISKFFMVSTFDGAKV